MDEVKRAALISVVAQPGFQVIIEILDAQVKRLEDEVLRVNPTNETELIAAHRVAVGARWAVNEAIKEFAALTRVKPETKPLTRQEEDDLHIKALEERF